MKDLPEYSRYQPRVKLSFIQSAVLSVIYVYIISRLHCLEVLHEVLLHSFNNPGKWGLYGLIIIIYHVTVVLMEHPQWGPFWLLRFGYRVTPFPFNVGLALTVHCYFHERQNFAMASAACLFGYFHGYFSCSQDSAKQGKEEFKAGVESVRKLYEDAYKSMSDDSSKALEEAYADHLTERTLSLQKLNSAMADRIADKNARLGDHQTFCESFSRLFDSVDQTHKEHTAVLHELKELQKEKCEKSGGMWWNSPEPGIRWRPAKDMGTVTGTATGKAMGTPTIRKSDLVGRLKQAKDKAVEEKGN